ncbi:hypothetical protein Tco_0489798 [Tanacetum coccineum]
MAKLLKKNETLKRHYKELSDSIKTTRAKTIEHTTSLIAQNAEFKAQLQEKGFAIAALKNELRKLTGNSVNTKFAKSSILGKLVLEPHRNQSVVRQPTTFKSERPRISKPRFASQVDVNNDLPKPVTTHYLPKGKESACAKPHHMIAPGSSRYSSNDMVHNHYLEEAKKQTQEIGRNSKTSVMPSARSQSTANGSKPKPRINNQKSRNWPASKTRKIFDSSTTKVDSEPSNGSNEDITNQYECEQTLDVSAGTLNLSAGTSFNPKKEGLRVCSELEIHNHDNEPSSSKLVPKVVPLADKTATSRQELELLFHHHITMLRWRWRHLIPAKSNSLPHAHAQSTKTYWHQDSRIKKAQELKTKTFTNSNIQDLPSRYQDYQDNNCQGRLLASFQDDAKYEHSSYSLLELIGRWTKDHPLANMIGNPSRPVSTRKQLETDAMWCSFDAFLTYIEPKNFKEAMLESSWIEAIQEEIHEFERLQV